MSTLSPDKAEVDSVARELSVGQRVLVRALAWVIRAWSATLRFEADEATRRLLEGVGPPGVVVLWHNRVFLTPALFLRYRRGRRPMAAMISASTDGAWLAMLLGLLGVRPARGSSSRRSLTAVRELQRLLAEGHDVTITPDGPRGPCYDFKVGPVFLARAAGCPVVLVNAEFSRAARLGSWDRTRIPWPFSTVCLHAEQVDDLASREWESNEAAAAWLGAKLLSLVPADAAEVAGR